MPIDLKDGFIHFSTAAQLRETLRLHFAGQSGLVVFAAGSFLGEFASDAADVADEAT